MTWFKVDDGLHSHRKVLSIPRKDRAAAMGLWVLAGSWCADNLTDGHVPAYMVAELGSHKRLAQVLVNARLWLDDDDGYAFHAWNDDGRQPTRAEVEANRESERKRKAEWRARSKDPMSPRDNGGTDSGTDGGTPASVPVGVRTPRPDPTRPVLSSGLGSQSPNGRSEPAQGDGLDLDRIKSALRSDSRRAELVAGQILAKAPRPPGNPTAYVVNAIGREPHLYRETSGPPPLGALCDEHGRDRATCPRSWHEESA